MDVLLLDGVENSNCGSKAIYIAFISVEELGSVMNAPLRFAP